MATQTKRTRSQLTITDYFSRHQAQAAHSPYKLAKEAARLNIYSNSSETTTPDPPNLEAHDEESLPSHNTTRPKKRSSSPFQREDVGGENGARVMKRVKRDGSDIEAQDASSDHRGMLPGSTQPSGPFDFSVISPRRPAPSSSSPSTPRRRAQSVPPSPSSAVPHFDLMKLESSPARAPSTSPTRQQLRFTSMPRVLEAIGDDMDVDVDADHLRPLLPLEQPATPHQTNGDVRIYATPRASDALDISVHSPLTPLPPTPAPFSHSVIHTSSDISSESVALSGGESTPRATPKYLGESTDPSSIVSGNEATPKASESAATIFPAGSSTPAEEGPEASTSALIPPSISVSRLPRPSVHSRKLSSSSLSSVPTSEPDVPSEHKAQTTLRPTVTAAARGRGKRLGGLGKRPTGPARITRSTSMKQQKDDNAVAGPSTVITTEPASPPRSTTVGATIPKSKPFNFSFAAPTSSSLSKAVEKSPAKKPISLPKHNFPRAPSPVKPASSLGMGWKAPTNKFSSLSTLSMALEKLKMPPPSRPATSVGFNDTAQRSSGEQETQDDSVVGRTTSKTGKSIRGPSPIKRATTVSSITSAKHTASGSKASVYVRPAHKAPVAGPSRINLGSGIVRGKPVRSATNIFGGPMRVTEKVSKKSSLPVVMGSPVKGGSLTEEAEEADMATMSNAAGNGEAAEENGEKRAAIPRVEPMDLSAAIRETDPVARGLMGPPGDSHQEVAPPDRWKANPSRRASMASQLLSQTLAELPQTPPRKAKASVEPVQSGSPRSPSERAKTLRSASGGHMTGSKSAPGALGKGNGVGAHVTASGSDSASGSGKKKLAHTLKVLKSCTVFVDVRSDDGDDAGGLFVDMLRGLGARILGSAGTTCTHIVYKNGLMSTLTKYRLMDEPKPFVVGIAWVVECAEQRAKADESKFLVDLELVNVAGTNKRRRSMLPKHIYSMPRTPPSRPWMSSAGAGTSSSAGDQSMDGNSSVEGEDPSNNVLLDEDLPPLERARKRRSLMLGR